MIMPVAVAVARYEKNQNQNQMRYLLFKVQSFICTDPEGMAISAHMQFQKGP